MHQIFNFDEAYLLFLLSLVLSRVISKKPLPNISCGGLHLFSSMNSIVLALILRFLIHFQLIFIFGIRLGSDFFP